MSGHEFGRRDFLILGGAAVTASAFTVGASSIAQEIRAAVSGPASDAMRRADELLRQMTVDEKAMQLSCVVPPALLDRDGLMP